jgi:hypothetical protein
MFKILALAATIALAGASAAVSQTAASQTAATPDKQAEVEYIITQNATVLKTYGKILGWELGSEKVISPSLVERLYILKTEALPLYYKIQFYRPASSWIVGNLYFTDTYKNIQ